MKPFFTRARIFSALVILGLTTATSTALRAQSYLINTFAGNATAAFAGDGGAATSASLQYLQGVAADAAGNVYIADASNNRIRKVSTSGIISTFAGNGSTTFSGDGGAATSAGINGPYGVAVDASGNVYITDRGNSRIRKVNTSGIISTIAGNGSASFSGDGGAAVNAALQYPIGVAVDASGNVYISDSYNSRIRKVNTSGIISTFAGNGTYTFGGDGGAATSAGINNPFGVAVDASGNVYIADNANNRVRKVNTSGIISTIAGNGTTTFSGDGGPATSAGIRSPFGIVTDASGNLYIGEEYNNRIRKVTSSGIVSTIAGNGTGAFGGDGGAATSASIKYPAGVATDVSGNVYIGDYGNSRVRKLTPLNGLAFDGLDDYVQSAGNTGITGNAARTFECWVKMPTYPVTGNAYREIMFSGSFQNFYYGFILYTINGTLHFTPWGPDYNTGYTFSDAGWHHVAVTYDGTTVFVYADAALVYSSTVNTLTTDPGKLILGSEHGSGNYFQGSIDEARLWNRALCQAEIAADMAGELPNATAQNGLVLYYTLDNGTAGGVNTGLSTTADASSSANNGVLYNFTSLGTPNTTSNWVAGATAITGSLPAYVAAPSTTAESITKTISGTTAFTGCGPIISIAPGTLSGSVTAKVWYDGSVQTINSAPYVQRHYDVEPATTQNGATANITLYFTQAEFTAYNAAANHGPDLPVDITDAANNRANLRITQYHGTPSGGNAPGNYPATWGGSGAAHLSITPTSVTYNSAAGRWDVVIPVTGFSGFFASSGGANPLPIRLESFTAKALRDKDVLLSWQVANQSLDDNYAVERSGDGNNFSAIGKLVKPTTATEYSLHDYMPLSGRSHYRLKVTGVDGSTTYSGVRSIVTGKGSYAGAYPSPAKDYVIVETSEANTTAVITDMQGRALVRIGAVKSGDKIGISSLAPGLYILKLSSGQSFKITKE